MQQSTIRVYNELVQLCVSLPFFLVFSALVIIPSHLVIAAHLVVATYIVAVDYFSVAAQ